MYQLKLVNYFDVWGNKKEGYEVNNLCVECDDIYVSDLENRNLLHALKIIGFLKKETRINQIEFNNSSCEMIEFYERKTQKPLGRLEVMREISYDTIND
jgi:hypothetical protein